MKKIHSIIGTIVLICCFVVGSIPTNVLAKTNEEGSEATREFSDSFTELVEIILEVKDQNPQLSEKQMITIIEEKIKRNRGIIDVWEALTDSEKVLVIRYPFDALKVNTARNIATSQTEVKFGYNGLGDRSDAFRHGI